MARKNTNMLLAVAAVAVVYFLLGNDSVRENLGPLGDLLSANKKIVLGVLIGVVAVIFFAKEKTRRSNINYMSTEGVVCMVEDDDKNIIDKDSDTRLENDIVYIPTIKYTVNSKDYEKYDYGERGRNRAVGDKYTVFYNPNDPKDCYVRREESDSRSVKDILLNKNKR